MTPSVEREPRATFNARAVIWIVALEPFASSYRVWRGPRTTVALERELRREAKAGRTAHIELETSSCSPVALTLDELVALGVLS